MRPKKVVLCVDADEDRLGRLVMLLETWGYRVERAGTAAAALLLIEAAKPSHHDALLVEAEQLGAENLIARAKRVDGQMGTMLLGYGADPACVPTQAHVFLPRILCRPAEILERLRILTARKRGPKKVQNLTQSMEAVA